MKKHVNIPIFVPHDGCPNDCSFCNQKKITGQSEKMTPQKADEIIRQNLSTVDAETTETEVAFFGGSFTGIPIDEQKELLIVAKKYKDMGKIVGIRLSTRPDYIDDDILSMLKSYGVTAVELGAQSMDDRVLLLNDRGHTADDTKKASKLIHKYGIELGLQMMVGLFGDTDEGALFTAKEIIALKPSCVRIYPTLIIKETKLATLYLENKYKPIKLDDAADVCAKLVSIFEKENIKVLRIGLLASDNINFDTDVLAGPFHPSFGELCKSRMFLNEIINEIDKTKTKKLEIFVNPRYVSIATGNKKSNIKYLKNNFRIENIKIIQKDTVLDGMFTIKQE